MSSVNCTNVIIELENRRVAALSNVPLTRFTLVSPYPEFTKHQLDMRRKIEVLKYSNNASNSKTNNLTKKQHWAQIVSGNNREYSQNAINSSINSSTICPEDDFLQH
jgi:hypothetical protein